MSSDTGRQHFKESIIIDTAKEWSESLYEAVGELKNIHRISLDDIDHSNLNWETYFEKGQKETNPELTLHPYQTDAFDSVVNGFNELDDNDDPVTRGKLIMACGTGKTFVSLKITETLVKDKGLVLFLVPSLALINQTIRCWSNNANPSLKPTKKFAVCSDMNTGKRKATLKTDEDLSTTINDLYIPATNDSERLAQEVQLLVNNQVVIIFSTYQSLDKIIAAQQSFDLPQFDLVICDEAHRTATIGRIKTRNRMEKFFTKIHNNKLIDSKKRLYMTATPKIYMDSAKAEAIDAEADLFSMDDEKIFGKRFYTYSFTKAIANGQLTDYRLVLAKFDNSEYQKVQNFLENNDFIQKYLERKQQAKNRQKINFRNQEDFFKLIAVYKQFCKLGTSKDDYQDIGDSAPMQKVMGFASSIQTSKDIKNLFQKIIEDYQNQWKNDSEAQHFIRLKTQHIDGSITGKEREKILNWLKKPAAATCKLITNVNCLSEGVDVPTLDGVVFFQPRQSEINIIQCIGRVMRKSPGKKWGYIMIPIFIPEGANPQEVLNDSKEYKRISKVINALRSVDENFDSKINVLSLNENASLHDTKIMGIGSDNLPGKAFNQLSLEMDTKTELESIAFSKCIRVLLIKKCVDSNHWEDWVKDNAAEARETERKIKKLIKQDEAIKEIFSDFYSQLKETIEPNINKGEAIEMINQHLITKPIFDAIFADSGSLSQNVVAQGLDKFITILNENDINLNDSSFTNFYNAIKNKVIALKDDNFAKQSLLKTIYSSFFTAAFPKQQKRLGIVYTPIEIVDFMLHSVEHLFKKRIQ